MRKFSTWLIWSSFLLILQSLVINKIQVYGFLNPYIYIGIFLFAPTSFGKIPLLFVGALIGAWIDFQIMTGGIHMMASSLFCYFRPRILDFIIPRADEEDLPFLPVDIGLGKWLIYAMSGTIVHHTYLFSIDAHSFNEPLLLIWRIFISTMASTLLITSILYFAKNKIDN
jgi:hypothetical protein